MNSNYITPRTDATRRGALTIRLITLITLITLQTFTARAADANALATTINGWTHGGTGTLTATLTDAHTVTVTGTVVTSDAFRPGSLMLNINSGVTVVWDASLTVSNVGSPGVIELSGSGIFEVSGLSEGATLRIYTIQGTLISTSPNPLQR